MQTELVNTVKSVQQNLMNLSNSYAFEDEELKLKFSELLKSFEAFSESTASVNTQIDPPEFVSQDSPNNTPFKTTTEVITTSLENNIEKVVNEIKPHSLTTNLLLNDPYASILERPNVYELTEATGLSGREASSLISAGLNNGHDYRNWREIMLSSDPVASIRQANNLLYNSDLVHTPNASAEQYIQNKKVLATNGNFALIEETNGRARLMLTAKDGLMLEPAGTFHEQIARRIDRYGFEKSDLLPLIAKVEQVDSGLSEQLRILLST